MKRNIIIFKCFIQFTCTNLDGSKKEGPNFYRLLQKEEVTQMGGRGAVPSEKGRGEGGSQPWRKLWNPVKYIRWSVLRK